MAKYRKLGRTSSQRKALIRSQVTALLHNGRIITTEARAKEVRKVAEGLIASAVKVLLKIAVSFVLGMNIIQGMIAPAMDKLAENTITKTMQMIPGIGNVMSGMGQIFLASGLMIKNCLGATALVILVILCAVPFLKMAVLAVLYKFLAAVLEPIADKRLSGGMNGIANGGMLYLKIISTCLMMFFLSIALSSAATGLGG